MNIGVPSLEEALDLYLKALREQERSPKTRSCTEWRLRPFAEKHGRLPVNEITSDQVLAWVEELKERLAPASVNSYKQTTKTFFNWCIQRGWVGPGQSPAANLRQVKFKRKRKHPEDGHLYRLLRTAERLAQDGDPEHIRNFALVLFSVETAGRLGEITRLRIPDVNLAKREAISYGKTGEVTLTFTEVCADALQAWLTVRPRGRHNFVWTSLRDEDHGKPLGTQGVTMVFVRLSKEAGLEKAIRTHAIRHWNGQKYVDLFNPKMAAEKLNHRSGIGTVLEFYYHVDASHLRTATAVVSPAAVVLQGREDVK